MLIEDQHQRDASGPGQQAAHTRAHWTFACEKVGEVGFMYAHPSRHFPLRQATALKFPAKPLSCWHESRVGHALDVVKGVSVKILHGSV